MEPRLKLLAVCGLSLVLTACGKGGKTADLVTTTTVPTTPNASVEAPLANTRAYQSNSAIAATALLCAKVEKESESCQLKQLAPIAFTHPAPSKNDIMERVLVSHDWMGQRFEELLSQMPDDITYLLGGVTAIVIDDDIRPSYYDTTTGAIYLDPDDFWLTEQERAVINPTPDYRAAFAEPMAFRPFWRYLIPRAANVRSLDSIETDLASLLFHELAHANDLFPRDNYTKVDTNQSILTVINGIGAQTGMSFSLNYFSTQLTADQPLQSTEMKNIANILFRGLPPSSSDRLITATQAGQFFAGDGANDDYAYTSQYEDLAMLFEEVMMKLHYAADRDVAFVNPPSSGTATCSYTIGWGMRNRIADPRVKARARWAVAKLLPNRDYSMMFDKLEPPKLIPPGLGWCASADFDKIATTKFEKSEQPMTPSPLIDLNDMLPRSELRHFDDLLNQQ